MENKDNKPSSKSVKMQEKNQEKNLDALNYPPSEDIYNKGHKEGDINPADITKKKIPVGINNERELNEKNFKEDMSGSDLDVPGSELDDAQEEIGSEDEENNYYSIGGDDHNDLDEDNG